MDPKLTKVVPFNVELGRRENAADFAKKKQKLIDYYLRQGWEYSHMESVSYFKPAGCLAFFSPAEEGVVYQLIFKAEASSSATKRI